jgi:predicted Zn-dependent protease
MTTPQGIVDAALAASTADGCIVIAAEHTESNLRWAANSLTTNGQMRSRSVTVIATFDHGAATSAGVVTRAIGTLEEVDDLVRAAEQAGRAAEPADDAAPLVGPYPNDDDWDADPAETSAAVFEQFAPALGATFKRWSAADQLLYGFAEHTVTSTFLGSSTGLRRRFDQADGRLEVNGKSADLTRSAWDGAHTRDFRDIDVVAIAAGLEQRLDWARTRIDVPAGRYETILPPSAVADLMIYAYWSAGARDAEEGRSAFASTTGSGTRIGTRLTPRPITLRSDPHAEGIECAPFAIATESDSHQSIFDNGLVLPAASWITDGRSTELIRTRAWAARTGAAPRPYLGNLLLDGGPAATASLDDLIAGTERGLLLTCLWYIREVDPQTLLLTGLTRDGVYLIENGQVQGAVNNFRFNESPLDLLSRVSEVGRAVPTLPREWADYFQRARMPPIRVPDFNMSTVSPAS